MYRSVPLIRPHILYQPKVGGGLIFEYAISLEYKPSPKPHPFPKKKKVLRDRYVHFQSSCLHKNTVTKAHRYYIGEELPVQCEVNNIHDNFAVAVLILKQH